MDMAGMDMKATDIIGMAAGMVKDSTVHSAKVMEADGTALPIAIGRASLKSWLPGIPAIRPSHCPRNPPRLFPPGATA